MTTANELKDELMRVRRDARELHSHDDVQAAIGRVAVQLTADYSERFPVFVTIMNGGMVFAGQLLTRLDFPLEVDYLHASRYLGDTSGGDVQWIVTPTASLAGRDVVILDDILDVGNTLLAIIEACKAQGAATVSTCVLVDKVHDRKAQPGLKADYTALEAEDHYLFGMGMDYKGYWRNAPGIFALDEEG
ncbi:hypoxanthine-guanine phosphoribosyltransferase [Alloalcanivorax gelatiniphagus]|mgnify:CR=1 FL=1|uniref:Hypoxanthine-guanine phosphoribosyltransferase n=1 Tax=Alloalcanivorax gelatiniphagus TaxID=1194167 RepID=A0ABY2XPB1_9GAMM|nr:hypoxanthine-guanine phosphoribosyltransferase [Alloalcanivorax gelatiniphagus]TMW14394.1 hypoxanthine-guanine phosphoribosyltransferase [Alloalcanivorax gelatiniphagus]|tara:strand:+ start:4452 stop:5021 length:570 start_codon:yes stop_codon:yes gene_type:complete